KFFVLHTWGRNPMIYHPHVHFVVAGGGIRLDDAVRHEADSDQAGYRKRVRPRLCAARAASGFSQSPVLWLDASTPQD
ncbi:MAG: transposase, partial [Parvibaculaceae bacterium]